MIQGVRYGMESRVIRFLILRFNYTFDSWIDASWLNKLIAAWVLDLKLDVEQIFRGKVSGR